MEHIQFVLNCMEENTTKVTNMRAMLITALYNSVNTISSYYSSLYNYHRTYGIAEKKRRNRTKRKKRRETDIKKLVLVFFWAYLGFLFWRFFGKAFSFDGCTKTFLCVLGKALPQQQGFKAP